MGAVFKHKLTFKLSFYTLSHPDCHVELFWFLVLPPMMLARVAASLCPSAFELHVALEWPVTTRKPCVQQYPLGSMPLHGLAGCLSFAALAGCAGGVLPDKRRVYAVVSATRLAVRAATFAVRVALFSTNWVSVVFSVVAAAAKLSRYPSRRAKVLSGMGDSSMVVTALAVPPKDDVPAASCWRRRA